MKFLHAENDRYVFHLAKQEKELLALILGLYPVIPSAHQPLSKSSAAANKANQHLLDEALAEQRAENKNRIEAFLADARHFHETGASGRMLVTAAEIEWLLQVLNDVRVGNWILMGSPDEELSDLTPDNANAPRVGAMELAGFFQMNLLSAVNSPPVDPIDQGG